MEKKTYFEAWIIIILISGLIFLAGLKAALHRDSKENMLTKDIIETAKAEGMFSILINAVQAAELTDALKSKSPVTLFAPTDEAFAKLPEDVLDDLLKPENKSKLRNLLKHHLTAGIVPLKGKELNTVKGGKIRISIAGRWLVNDAAAVKRNIRASNGMIHAVNEVLLAGPASQKRAALKLIEATIELGASLFNNGEMTASAQVYKSALDTLRTFGDNVITPEIKSRIEKVLTEADTMNNPGEIAWKLRYLLDDITETLTTQNRMMN